MLGCRGFAEFAVEWESCHVKATLWAALRDLRGRQEPRNYIVSLFVSGLTLGHGNNRSGRLSCFRPTVHPKPGKQTLGHLKLLGKLASPGLVAGAAPGLWLNPAIRLPGRSTVFSLPSFPVGTVCAYGVGNRIYPVKFARNPGKTKERDL